MNKWFHSQGVRLDDWLLRPTSFHVILCFYNYGAWSSKKCQNYKYVCKYCNNKLVYVIIPFIYCIYIYIWVNENISPTWIKAIWGWFPLLTMIPVRSQWGRHNLPRYIYIYTSYHVGEGETPARFRMFSSRKVAMGEQLSRLPADQILRGHAAVGAFWCFRREPQGGMAIGWLYLNHI